MHFVNKMKLVTVCQLDRYLYKFDEGMGPIVTGFQSGHSGKHERKEKVSEVD